MVPILLIGDPRPRDRAGPIGDLAATTPHHLEASFSVAFGQGEAWHRDASPSLAQLDSRQPTSYQHPYISTVPLAILWGKLRGSLKKVKWHGLGHTAS